jgi:hypothetical protein
MVSCNMDGVIPPKLIHFYGLSLILEIDIKTIVMQREVFRKDAQKTHRRFLMNNSPYQLCWARWLYRPHPAGCQNTDGQWP